MAGSVWIGTSGWNYKHWANGVFYPKEIKQSEWFSFYCRHFNTVEINNTFYQLPSEKVFQNWRRQSPDGFTFAIKASRFITHIKKLKDPEESGTHFLRNVRGLSDKLGVVLFQLPGSWKFNRERLEAFLGFLRDQTILPRFRAALEIRNATWNCEECFELLRAHNVSLVLADWPELPIREPVTADFVFVRRHGPGDVYASNYPDSALQEDARQIRRWSGQGKDVFIYFNNDAHGYAVKNALRLKELVQSPKKGKARKSGAS